MAAYPAKLLLPKPELIEHALERSNMLRVAKVAKLRRTIPPLQRSNFFPRENERLTSSLAEFDLAYFNTPIAPFLSSEYTGLSPFATDSSNSLSWFEAERFPPDIALHCYIDTSSLLPPLLSGEQQCYLAPGFPSQSVAKALTAVTYTFAGSSAFRVRNNDYLTWRTPCSEGKFKYFDPPIPKTQKDVLPHLKGDRLYFGVCGEVLRKADERRANRKITMKARVAKQKKEHSRASFLVYRLERHCARWSQCLPGWVTAYSDSTLVQHDLEKAFHGIGYR